MVRLSEQSIICFELHKKVTNSSPKCKWNTLENAVINGIKGATGCEIEPIKNMKARVKLLVHLVMPKRVHWNNDKCVWFALDGKI